MPSVKINLKRDPFAFKNHISFYLIVVSLAYIVFLSIICAGLQRILMFPALSSSSLVVVLQLSTEFLLKKGSYCFNKLNKLCFLNPSKGIFIICTI